MTTGLLDWLIAPPNSWRDTFFSVLTYYFPIIQNVVIRSNPGPGLKKLKFRISRFEIIYSPADNVVSLQQSFLGISTGPDLTEHYGLLAFYFIAVPLQEKNAPYKLYHQTWADFFHTPMESRA